MSEPLSAGWGYCTPAVSSYPRSKHWFNAGAEKSICGRGDSGDPRTSIGRLDDSDVCRHCSRRLLHGGHTSTIAATISNADLATLRARLTAADASNAVLFDALYDYGKHRKGCQAISSNLVNEPCTCGLEDILTAVHPGKSLLAELEELRALVKKLQTGEQDGILG